MHGRELFTSADAAREGVSRQQLRTRLRRGQIAAVGHGVYTYVLDGDVRDIDRIRAAILRAPRGAVLTGDGAAHMLGLARPYLTPIARFAFLLPEPMPGQRRTPTISVTARNLPRSEILEWQGIRVTSPAWTALELALQAPLARALVPLDSALRLGVERARLQALLREFAGRRGSRGLARAIAEASPLSESGLESQSRGVLLDAGLPRPELQLPVRISGGRTVFVDFGWPHVMLAGEADGLVKYTDDGVYRAEKIREMQITRRGIAVERWTQWDLDHGLAALLERLFRHFD